MKPIKPKATGFKNNEEWYKNLSLDKQMFIAQRVKKRTEKIQNETEQILDSCYIGAMIELFEIDLDKCIEIAEKANVNMRITEQFLSEEGEKYYMKVNDEKLREEIRLKAKELLKSKPKESTIAISRELEKEYKMPAKDLHILVSEARKEIKTEEKENKKEIAPDQEIKATLTSEGEHGFEISKTNLKEDDIAANIIQYPSKCKVKSIEVEWESGRTYLKSQEGVKLEDKLYKDITDVKHAREVLQSNTKATEDNINKKIEELTKQLEEALSNKKIELEKYAELEAVFAM